MFDNIERIQTWVWTRKNGLWQGMKAYDYVGYFALAPANRERGKMMIMQTSTWAWKSYFVQTSTWASYFAARHACFVELLATELFPIITSFDRSVQQVRNSISGVQNVHLGKGKKIGEKKIWTRASPTWKWRMIVQMRPRVSLGLPSTMSSPLMLTSLISL